jgi:hypothetical protein
MLLIYNDYLIIKFNILIIGSGSLLDLTTYIPIIILNLFLIN